MSCVDLVVVMGVSGAGKTTVAQGIALAMGWEYVEGDDFHPAGNVATMASGTPLADSDRWPWLITIGEWLSAHERSGRSAVVTCSALRRSYRDLLREGRPDVRFCHVHAEPALLESRLRLRAGHYMPVSLLPSQLDTLEPLAGDEPGVVVTAIGTAPETLVRAMRALGLTPPEA